MSKAMKAERPPVVTFAAIVALAETLGLSRVATTDRRHFDPLARALSLHLVP